jgi:FkbM family methyltransferase
MGLRSIVQGGIERLIGARIVRTMPHGVDLFADLRTQLPATQIATVFDVGANIGQSARHYREAFPAAQLYCFEPVQATFDRLAGSLRDDKATHCFRLAFGRTAGTGEIAVGQHSDQASLTTRPADTTHVESVPVETLDGFCSSRALDRVGLLKIDTEGGDLTVLEGAEALLAGQKIDVIEVEAGMSPRNARHVPFEAFTAHLGARNYFLFGIYEQVLEWTTREPNLRRVNPVFISERVVKANGHR